MVMIPDPDAVLSTISNIPIEDTARIDAQLNTIPERLAETIYVTMSEEIRSGKIIRRPNEEIYRYMIIFTKLGVEDGFGPDRERFSMAYSGYLQTGSLQSIAKLCTDEADEGQSRMVTSRITGDLDHTERRELNIEIDTWTTLGSILNENSHT